MISSQKIKALTKKRVSKKAITKINSITIDILKKIIKKAERNADFSGRKTIKKEDIKDELS